MCIKTSNLRFEQSIAILYNTRRFHTDDCLEYSYPAAGIVTVALLL